MWRIERCASRSGASRSGTRPRRCAASRLPLALSRSPCWTDDHLEGRHIDLRPFLLFGREVTVQPGGLTRGREDRVEDWSWGHTRRRLGLLWRLTLPYRRRTALSVFSLLAATAYGLGIAIFCVVPFNYFQRKTERLRFELETAATNVEVMVNAARQRGSETPAYSQESNETSG